MRRVLIVGAISVFFAGCGGGGGGSTSIPSTPNSGSLATSAPSSNTVTLTVPADANGGIIAGISDELLVGSITNDAGVAPVALSVGLNASANSSSVHRKAVTQSVPRSSGSQWIDGPSPTDVLRPVLATLRATGVRAQNAVRRAQSLPETVGSQATIWVQYFAAGVPGTTFEQVPATLAAQTAHASVWVQNSLDLLTNQSALSTIASNIENAMASDNAHFGSSTWDASAPSLGTQYATCDANGNRNGGSSSEFIVPADPHVNFVYVDPSEIAVGGYMDSDSLLPEDIVRCTPANNGTYHSNEAPTIVLAYYGDSRGMSYVLQEDSIVHPAHEYQHLINMVHHAILQPTPSYEDGLLNEGLSMLAQDFAIAAATNGSQPLDGENIGRSQGYLSATQNYSVAAFAGLDSPSTVLYNCATCYSPAWLLERYLYDRFGGDTYTHAMEAGTQTSWPEVQTVTGVAPQQLLHDFALTLASSNTSAATPPYEFSSLNLHTTYTDQFGTARTLSGPAPLATLASGSSASYSVLPGAYVYFAVPASSASASASLSDGTSSSFDLLGGVISF